MYSCFLPITVLCFLTLVVQSCTPFSTPPPRNFATRDLLVENTQLPRGWFVAVDVRPSTLKFAQEEGAEVQFNTESIPGGIAFQIMLRYQYSFQSALKFDQAMAEFYPPPPHVIDGWRTPQELSYKSPIADQFYVACAYDRVASPVGRQQSCIATAQYEEYLSIFKTEIVDGYMSYTDLEQILRDIDRKMTEHLGKTPAPSRTP